VAAIPFSTAGAPPDFESALSTFRRTLPDCGFKLVVPPPRPGTADPEVFASVWRRGDERVVCHRGETVANALLQAMRVECEKRAGRNLSEGCSRCRGTGLYLSAEGAPVTCRHRANS
jgi:hypothetical protein